MQRRTRNKSKQLFDLSSRLNERKQEVVSSELTARDSQLVGVT